MFRREQHTIWSRETGHSLISAPVVGADLVVTIGLEQSSLMAVGYLDAWDRSTGQHRWSFSGEASNGLAGGVSGDPVVVGDRLYFAAGRGALRCLDLASGREVWRHEVEKPVHTGPAIASDRLFMASDEGTVTCLDLATGGERWAFHAGGVILASPVVADGRIIMASWDGKLHALTPEGTLACSADISPARPTRIVARAGRVVLCDVADNDVRMVAVTPRAETVELAEGWRLHTGDASKLEPLLLSDRAYWTEEDRDSVTCVDAATGATQWTRATGRAPLAAVAFGDLLMVASHDGQLLALDPQSGQTRWQLATGIPFSSAPTAAEGVVFIGGSDHSIYALRPERRDATVPV